MNIRRSYIRLFALLAGLALCASSFGSSRAFAETSSKPARWQNEYQAYGRTIKIDTEITVPEKTVFPVLAVKEMPELSSEKVSEYQELFDAMDKTGDHAVFRSKKNEIYISYSDHKGHPDLADPGKVTNPRGCCWNMTVTRPMPKIMTCQSMKPLILSGRTFR